MDKQYVNSPEVDQITIYCKENHMLCTYFIPYIYDFVDVWKYNAIVML